MDKKSYDFAGWATKYNVKCHDGRTLLSGAFKHCDGITVPLVWNHNHNDMFRVLGHAILEERPEGVYAYGSFNNTDEGKTAREYVTHGDIAALSIYANGLKQNGGEVIHGSIKEVSLVLAGCNPGAKIETIIAHSDNSDEEAVIYNCEETFNFPDESKENDIEHSDDKVDDVEENNIEHSDNNEKEDDKEMATEEKKEKTVQDVFDELTEEQKTVVYALIGQAVEDAKNEKNNDNNEEDDTQMKHNVFENENNEEVLTHADFMEIINDAKKTGSLKDAFLAHGITDVSNLFPEAQAVSRVPETIERDMDWVEKVMAAVHHTPFSRVKSMAINITADEARAKGYVKGTKKVEEVIAALKRVINPTTVYKLQKLDRDDVLDITDFDVVAYIKDEMRKMLNEEIARAILIGDGRSAASPDKVNPLNIVPILGDNSVYTTAKILERGANDTDSEFAKAFIQAIIKARKDYKGSGNPVLFTTEDMLTSMLLIEDSTGRVIYDTEDKLRTALRVREILTVEPMEECIRTDNTYDYQCLGILVNLRDYNVGADKGGQVTMFDDFDINYNKQEYLIETRCSGGLVKPRSAVTFELKTEHQAE